MNTNRKAEILILEDEPMTKKEMETLFPYSFTIKKTRESAIQLFKQNKNDFDLIIIDDLIRDPLEALIQFRLSSKTTPIYIMTHSTTFKQKALRYGATGIMEPPFDTDSYISIFKTHFTNKPEKIIKIQTTRTH